MAREVISDAVGKVYRVHIRSIVGNTNPRNPLSSALQKLGYGVFENKKPENTDLPIWDMATSSEVELRQRFVQLMQDHDPEFCSWAQTFITQGQLQPVELRDNGKKSGDNTYTLVFGCRRCLAILYNWALTGKPKEPIVEARLAKGNNNTLLHRAVVENTRKNPSPIEEAKAMGMDKNQGLTEEEIAEQYGVSTATVKNRLALLELEEAVQRKIHEGKLSASKALEGKREKDPQRPRKVRKQKVVLQMLEEFAPDTIQHKMLSWFLGLREDF